MKYVILMFPQLFLLACLLFVLPGCGSGGGGDENGATNSVVIGAVQATLVLPDGVTVETDGSGNIISEAVTASGKAAGVDIDDPLYTPATPSSKGTITLQILRLTGFELGEFVTINCVLADGVSPKLSDFEIASDYQVRDLDGKVIDRVSVIVGTVTPSQTSNAAVVKLVTMRP